MAGNALDIQISVSRDTPDISMAVDRNWKNVSLAVDKGGKYYPAYDGPYAADASFYYDKTMETYGRVMTDNFKVNRIPVVETINPQGGKTIMIGV